MNHMEEKVFAFMEKWEMIEPKDRVVAGISGGADSVCLLFLLLEYRKRKPFSLVVCHVNHGMRREADEDEAYVKGLCEENQLPFVCTYQDVQQIAKEKRLSAEEAGRMVRYAAFSEIQKNWNWEEGTKRPRIAVAHHLQDSAETVLFNLFRGTGVWGLTGIRPDSEGIIRPLLTSSRQEIEEYLIQRKISWCIDKSNAEDTYTRNRIRNQILPYVEENIVQGAVRHIGATASDLLSLTEYIEEEGKRIRKNCCCRDADGVRILLDEFVQLHPFFQRQLLLWEMEEVCGKRQDISRIHVENLLELTKKEGYKRMHLPHGLTASKEFNQLRIAHSKEAVDIPKETMIMIPGSYLLPEGKKLEISLIPKEKIDRMEENRYTKYLDYDRICNCLTLRNRQQGDYLTIDPEGRKKSLKKYMIEEKIGVSFREKIPVIAEGNHILWVIGYRISAAYKVSEQTKTCLRLHME